MNKTSASGISGEFKQSKDSFLKRLIRREIEKFDFEKMTLGTLVTSIFSLYFIIVEQNAFRIPILSHLLTLSPEVFFCGSLVFTFVAIPMIMAPSLIALAASISVVTTLFEKLKAWAYST